MLTAPRAREVLDYDKETGLLTWRVATGRRARVGEIAGHITTNGYLSVGIDGQCLQSHRVIWLWMTGAWPKDQIDHINLVRADNRWVNLREASLTQNNRNTSTRSDNKSGVKGVSWHEKLGKWRVRVGTSHVGVRENRDDAAALYAATVKDRFGDFARVSPIGG